MKQPKPIIQPKYSQHCVNNTSNVRQAYLTTKTNKQPKIQQTWLALQVLVDQAVQTIKTAVSYKIGKDNLEFLAMTNQNIPRQYSISKNRFASMSKQNTASKSYRLAIFQGKSRATVTSYTSFSFSAICNDNCRSHAIFPRIPTQISCKQTAAIQYIFQLHKNIFKYSLPTTIICMSATAMQFGRSALPQPVEHAIWQQHRS